ncbi:HhH-GPD family protein [Methanoculleus sediminis]|uniref:hypothetical protein n=1 Tax=Methanoculleus sediminis TaxID=1550566 RepID=UPI0019D3C0E8|nr:hypothetical protein [Methanoculleus sediminis]
MIAEFMLHRTRAEQVVPVYNELIVKYPDVFSLSEAADNEIRTVTLHLGLHWRAAHFKMAAQFIVENYHGVFPTTEEGLLAIPGVGHYAAGAILTVCYHKPYPVVDANIARFINRLYGLQLEGELRRKKGVTEIARCLFNLQDPGRFLFAVLDFTAAVCRPRRPLHEICPFRGICGFYNKEVLPAVRESNARS